VKPIEIGSRLELLIDDAVVDRLEGGAALRLHHPTRADVALVFDRPWEGSGCGYVTVFRDGNDFRMYYRASTVRYTFESYTSAPAFTCCAESADGIHWKRPDLGLCEAAGTGHNNVILTEETGGPATHNFSPFLDDQRGVPPKERYKALGGSRRSGLIAFVSADGIRWHELSETPVITKGAFDSQNLAFWDSARDTYRAYIRDFRDGRDIRTCTSADFRTWTEPEFLSYTPGRTSELYTNQVQPYYRAPHILIGFPTRYVERPWQAATDYLPQPEFRRLRSSHSLREGTAMTDGMLMTSRDGTQFKIWPESFIRPGLWERGNWFYGDNYQALGMVETPSVLEGAPRELSLFATELGKQHRPGRLRRLTIRVDGFVSANAPLSGGEVITRPLTFTGRRLFINYATGAAGSVRIEIQDPAGQPLRGYSLQEAEELFGDSLEQPVLWKRGADLSALQGQAVRVRFVLADADLYSYRFW